MCLSVLKKNYKRKIVKENIECYKVMAFWNDKYYTPFQEMFMKVGVRYDNDNEEDIGEVLYTELSSDNLIPYIEVNDGFYHSFKYKIDCMSEKLLISHLNNLAEYHVMRCIIPKGTEYIEGYGITKDENYASKSIVIVEKIC